MNRLDDDLRPWLETLGLTRHAATFAEQGVGLQALPHLSDADLQALGLPLGHRRTLQAALAERQQLERGPVGPLPAAGERRQITVMFCDLVGSSALAERFDPEDLRQLIHAYYSACCGIVEASGGFVARVVGDGVMAYFGYPVAREDAAECAIRAGLRILESVGPDRPFGSERIEVRIGLATGVSLIGDMVGIGFSELHAVLGPTPNLASRVQTLAEPGSLVIADETRRLAGGFFLYADAGLHALKGFSRSAQLWRVVGESPADNRFDAHRAAQVECVGRELQLHALEAAWREVQGGQCRLVGLVGEAGIGKSRLLKEAVARLALVHDRTALLQCAPSQATTPLHPLVDWLRRDIGLGAARSEADLARLRTWLGPDATALDLPLLAEFLTLSLDGVEVPRLPPDRKQQLMRDIVLRHFERDGEPAPSLLMLEDAHWMDGATEAFLADLFERMRERPLLVVATWRPGRRPRWAEAPNASELSVDPLPREAAERLLANACHGRTLPPALVDEILQKTDGVPLFLEELTAMVLESSALPMAGEGTAVPDGAWRSLDIPSTLRDSLMARLDRLSDVKEVARIASAIGRDFSFTLLRQVSEMPERLLRDALNRLVAAQLLFQRGTPPEAEYQFKHALVQQVAYDSQLRSERQALHGRIVRGIESCQPQLARQEPGLMAHHCEMAGLTDRSVDYLYAAGLASTRLVAIHEALSYFARADAAVARLEPSGRNASRGIEIILGTMEVGRFAILPSRLRDLSVRARQLLATAGVNGDAATKAAILFQEGRTRVYSSQYAQARHIFREIRQTGRTADDRAIERKPASAFCMALCCQGLFGEMLDFVHEDTIGYYRESGSFIDYISGLGWMAYACCETGSIADGLRFGDLSVREAEAVQSQIYLAGAYVWRSHAKMALRRWDDAVADARRCVDLSTTHAVPYLGWHGLVFLALCQARSGDLGGAEASLERARSLLAEVEDRQWSLLDYLPAIEAEIACMRGDHARAIERADQAIVLAGPIGGHFAEAMAWRVKAISQVSTGMPVDQAQALFDRALGWYERGNAKAERAFSALVWARSLQRAGHRQDARRWVGEAQALAQRHGFELERCEYGAAQALL